MYQKSSLGERSQVRSVLLSTRALAFAAIALVPAAYGADAATPDNAAAPVAPVAEKSVPAPAVPATDASAPDSADVVKLSKLQVKAKSGDDAIAPPTSEQAKASLSQIAGGTSFVDSKTLERGSASSTADILRFEPGVLAQQAGGNDSIKISIRGSYSNRGVGFFRGGVYFAFDGLPLTGPGGTPFELFEPLGLQHTEVLKGANGFSFGPTSLGGTINYVTKTGYDASPAELHVEAGSFGYVKGQIASGAVEGPVDYYVTAIGSYRDGYQNYSNSTSARVIGNIGYRFLPEAETRLFYRFGYTYFQQPGALTITQLEKDPTQANPASITNHSNRLEPGSHWVADKTSFILDDGSKLSFGVVDHNYPIQIGDRGSNVSSSWTQEDLSALSRYERKDQILDRPAETSVDFRYTEQIDGSVKRYNNRLNPAIYGTGPVLDNYARYDGSADGALTFENKLHILKPLTISTGLSFAYIRRNITNNSYADLAPFVGQHTYGTDTLNVLPRAGFIYEASKELSFFGNVSESVDPANAWSFAGNSTINKLRNQTATSYEVGFRPKIGAFEGSVSFFRSDVKNELLSVRTNPNDPNSPTSELNASPTTLQGIEVGLDTTLWHEGAKGADDQYKHRVIFRQSFTYSDFAYKNDYLYGKNQLPGNPPAMYHAELAYEHPSGFYAGLTADYASGAFVDYANTLKAPSYAIYGVRVGYQQDRGWSGFVDVTNLTDKHYAAAISPQFNVRGLDTTAVLSPGDGLGAIVGVTYKY